MGSFVHSTSPRSHATRFARELVIAATVVSTVLVGAIALPAAAASPTPTIDVATALTNTSATLNGTVNPGGTSTTLSFCYSTSVITITGGACTVTSGTILTATALQSPSTSASTISVTAAVTSLTAGTTYYYALGATQGANATAWSGTTSFTTMTGAPFTCVPDLYQENSNYLWKFNGATAAFDKVNTTAQATSLNPIGYDTLTNYIYGIGGTTLYQIGSDGNETSLGTPANVSQYGGDFLPGTNFFVTANAGTFDMIDVASTSPATAAAPASVKLGVVAGSATLGGYDIAFQLTGSNYVGYALAMSGTGTATLYKAVIPVSVITANSTSSAWSGLTGQTIANAVTVTQVTGITFGAGGTTPGNTDDFGAVYRDSAGDALFYADTAKEIYTATAAQLATGTSFVIGYTTAASILASGANDGASCPSSSSAFAAPTPVNDSYTTNVGTTLTAGTTATSVFANDQILPGATVSMGTVTLEPGAGQVTKTFSTSTTSGSLVGTNGTLNITNSTLGYFNFVPKAGFSGTETFTYNIVETAPYSLTSATSATVTITVTKIPQTITFTSTAPASPAVASTYQVTATGGASGNAVTFSIDGTSTSGCTINGSGLVTFTSPPGTCIVDANQAGNTTYLAAPQVQQSMTVVKANQTITFTSTAPTSPAVGATYTATATGGASGNAVTFSKDGASTSGCTVNSSTGLVTFTGPAGTCIVDANQAGNTGYNAAPQVQQTITVVKANQTITFTSTAPVGAVVGNTYTVTATGGASGNAVTFTKDGTSTSGCTVNSSTGLVTFTGPAGTCVIDANQAGNTSYNAAPQVQQTVTVGKANQTITITSTAPIGDVVGNTYTVTATGGASGNPVTFTVDGTSTSGCTVNSSTGLVTFTGPAGTCVIDANQAGNTSYNAAPQVQQSITVGKAAQAITFTSTPPGSPVVGGTYHVTATGGASGNAVVFTIDGTSTSGCTVNTSTGTVTFTGPAGTCVIDANQAGNTSYTAAPQVQQTITIGKAAQAISFTSTAPTSPSVGATYTVTATGGASGNPVTFSIDGTSTSGCTVNSSTGLVTFSGPAGTCVIDANQAGNASYTAAPQVQQTVTVGKAAQAITITSIAPIGDVVGNTYTVTATGGASGNPVTFSIDGTSTSGCTVNSSTGLVTFSGPAGTCVIDANQAGNASYTAAPQVQQTVTVGKAAQAITITSIAPIGDVVGNTYTVTATGGASGNPVTFSIDGTSTSGCTVNSSTGLVTFSGPAGTCVIDANQAGNASYTAAPQVQQTVTVGKAAQAITITSIAPIGDVVGNTYTVTATGGASGNPVTFSIDGTSTSGCTVNSSTGLVTFSGPAGTCVIDANQAGNASYSAAPEVDQSVIIGLAPQAITFTSLAPTSPSVGDTYTATATGGASGNPVTFSIDGTSTSGCTVNSSTGFVTFSGPAGTCVVDADQAGNASYSAAPEVDQSINVGKAAQVITITSTAPTSPVVGDTYTATATGGASGNPVTFSIDGTSTSGCTVNSSTGLVTFSGPAGTCVVDADQAGNASYSAAPEVDQSITVGLAPQAITFTSTAPTTPVVGDTYTATATGGASGNPVTFSIDGTSTSGCTVDSSTGLVTFSGPAGTCVVDADQAGNASYSAAPEVDQSITVGLAPQAITFTSTAPTTPVVGDTYTATATGGASGNPVTFSIDGSSTSGCTVDSSTGLVTFSGPAGTCVVDADQAGNASYLAAPEVDQLITVGLAPQAITFTSTAPTTPVVGDTYTAIATGGASGNPVVYSIDATSTSGCTVDSSTGLVTFSGPAGTCVVDADQAGNASYSAAPEVDQSITVGLAPQAITFTSTAPTTPVVGDSYTATATGGASGNPVTFSIDGSSTSGCTVDSSTGLVTFSGPAGTCVVDADQAGNASYTAAPEVDQSITVGKASDTIVITSIAPASPTVGGTYMVTATGGGSSSPIVYSIDGTSTSGCTVNSSTGLVTFTGPSGTCVIDVNQAGDSSYDAAAQVQQTLTVQLAAQAITFTSIAPTAPPVGATYTATATGGASGNPVTFSIDGSSTSGCTVNSSTGFVTFTGPAGTCVIDANQAGNTSYAAAPEVSQTINVGVTAQAITFTSTRPTSPVVGGTYTVTATGGGSGNPVTFTVDESSTSGCTVNSATGLVTFTGPPGTCVIDANQAGTVSFSAAPQVSQTIVVGKAPQHIIFVSAHPAVGKVGSFYGVVARATSNLKVTLVIDHASAGSCAFVGGRVKYLKAGVCVIDATQAGNVNYLAAARVQMKIRVIVAAHVQLIIYFANNSVALTAAAKKQLGVVARLALVDGLTKLAITGYASSTGSVAGNKALGIRRAVAAEKYLKTLLARLHVKDVHFTVAGKGASAFAVKNSKSGLNRRDVIQGS